MRILVPILEVLQVALQLYWWAVIIWIVMTWLVQFNVINTRNELVRMVGSTLNQLIDPVLRPIRRRLPMFGALDLSPIVLFLIILLIQRFLAMAIFELMKG
jgi:YggT family protein